MADFSFLNDDQEDGGFKEKPKGPVYTPLSGDTGESEEMGQGPGQTPEDFDASTDKTHEFQKKRAKAADFAKSETLKGLDRLNSKRMLEIQQGSAGGMGFGGGLPVDYESVKQKILASKPDQYATILYNEAAKHGSATDDILRPSEDAVTNYKRLTLQQQPEQTQGIQQQLSAQDVPNAKAQIASLDQTILRTQQDMAIAASPRQKQELSNNLQFFAAQKSQIQSKLPPEAEQGEEPTDHNLNMNAVLTAAGWDRKDFIQANTEVRRIVGTHGINPTDPVTPSTFPIIVPKIIEEVFKPEQARKFYEEIVGNEEEANAQPSEQSSSKGGDKQETIDPGLKDVNNRLAQSQARHDAIWKELAHSGNFNNVGDVIGFVLTSLVLGPKAGAALFSNMNKNGGLRNELAMIDRETTQLYHQQNSYIQLSQHARQQALMEEHQKDALKETERHHHEMEGIQYGRMKALASKMPDEMKNIASARLHGLRIAESNLKSDKESLDRWERAANNPMDPRFKTAKAALAQKTKDYGVKVAEMQKYRAELQKWFEENGAKVGGMLQPSRSPMFENAPQGYSEDE